MKRLIYLFFIISFVFACQDEKSTPGLDKIIRDYPGGGNWSDGAFAGFIFITASRVDSKGDGYKIKLADKRIFNFPKLEIDIYEVKDGTKR